MFIGQYVQKIAPTESIRLIIGLIILGLSGVRIYKDAQSKKRRVDLRQQNLPESNSTPGVKIEVNIESGETDPLETEKFNYASLPASILAGTMAGFLGGLVGAKGPAMILFFIFHNYDKSIVRAIGVCSSCLSQSIRLFTYLTTQPPEDWPGMITNSHPNNGTIQGLTDDSDLYLGWFVKPDWPLYLTVMLTALIGLSLGLKIHDRVNQEKFNQFLTILLMVSGLSMVIKSGIYFLQK